MNEVLALIYGGEHLAAWSNEKREERLWKCVTRRRGLLDKEARARLRGVAEQVRSHYTWSAADI